MLSCELRPARSEADCEHFTRLNFADGHEVEELRGHTVDMLDATSRSGNVIGLRKGSLP